MLHVVVSNSVDLSHAVQLSDHPALCQPPRLAIVEPPDPPSNQLLKLRNELENLTRAERDTLLGSLRRDSLHDCPPDRFEVTGSEGESTNDTRSNESDHVLQLQALFSNDQGRITNLSKQEIPLDTFQLDFHTDVNKEEGSTGSIDCKG